MVSQRNDGLVLGVLSVGDGVTGLLDHGRDFLKSPKD